MVMTEARKVALDHALTAATLTRRETIPADEIVASAEKFHAFLVGSDSCSGSAREAGVAGLSLTAQLHGATTGQPSQTDFAQADQSPVPVA